MCGLHRLLHNGEQLLTELLWVHRLAQRGTKGRQGLLSIVLLSIETVINSILDAPPHGLEEHCNGERSQSEICAGCIVSSTTASRCSHR